MCGNVTVVVGWIYIGEIRELKHAARVLQAVGLGSHPDEYFEKILGFNENYYRPGSVIVKSCESSSGTNWSNRWTHQEFCRNTCRDEITRRFVLVWLAQRRAYNRLAVERCRENSAKIRESRLDFGLGF